MGFLDEVKKSYNDEINRKNQWMTDEEKLTPDKIKKNKKILLFGILVVMILFFVAINYI